jgi:hypothetical protein
MNGRNLSQWFSDIARSIVCRLADVVCLVKDQNHGSQIAAFSMYVSQQHNQLTENQSPSVLFSQPLIVLYHSIVATCTLILIVSSHNMVLQPLDRDKVVTLVIEYTQMTCE